MLVSMNWIRDFVDLSGLDLDKLISRFTLSTAEVEDVIYKGREVDQVIVAKIINIENHPESKKLHLLKVDTGNGIKDVVCGAPNVREGMKTAFAQVGGKAKGQGIELVKIAGYESQGMCCSEAELGMSADHSGIMDILEEVPLGTDIKKLYEIEDIVFEVDNKSLTNRPDLWGHYGIAREFAALADRPLQPIQTVNLAIYDGLEKVAIDIEEKELAYRYTGLKVENIKVKVSPANMRIRLFYCGSRPINLLADLTNYLMMELGQPMHAFDAAKVDCIEVKRFDQPFDFQTLDGVSRKIDESTLMICSKGKPVAVAGVMGGYDSEITETTESLLLESANFDGISVRKTSTRLGLRTDASMRYEKILDPELTVTAVGRFVYLLTRIDRGAKVVSALSDVYAKHYDSIVLKFDKKYVDRYTGIVISTEQILRTLRALGFLVEYTFGQYSVGVPSWRATKDVTLKADIIEEITRIYGYDNFVGATTLSPLHPVRKENLKVDEYAAKELLVEKYRMHEVHSYLWCDAKKFKELDLEIEENVRLINSLTSENDCIRNSMLPTLLTIVNENKGFDSEFGIFEIGRVVEGLLPNGECRERKKLGIVLFSRDSSEKDLYFKLRDMTRQIGRSLKRVEPEFAPCGQTAHKWQHPVNSSRISLDGREVGTITVLHPANSHLIDKKAAIVMCELDMTSIAEVEKLEPVYEGPSKYPGIDIDLSLAVESDTLFADIESLVRSADCPWLKTVGVIDVYEENGQKSITIRMKFISVERTLSMEEVQKYVNLILEKLAEKNITLKLG